MADIAGAAKYDSWYDSARGRWIGDTEYRLLVNQLRPRPAEHILDVGCGTGWFTRRFADLPGVAVTGIDLIPDWLAYARGRDPVSTYLQADALDLPFADDSFDHVFSVAALCFVPNWTGALREILRVTRKRFAVGLLNRHSLLWREKGRGGGAGAYRGAHWHTPHELRQGLSAMSDLEVGRLQLRSAIFFPNGTRFARAAEPLVTGRLLYGGFIVISGEKLSNAG
jgi:SAM-dependent methyltransferase